MQVARNQRKWTGPEPRQSFDLPFSPVARSLGLPRSRALRVSREPIRFVRRGLSTTQPRRDEQVRLFFACSKYLLIMCRSLRRQHPHPPQNPRNGGLSYKAWEGQLLWLWLSVPDRSTTSRKRTGILEFNCLSTLRKRRLSYWVVDGVLPAC